MAKLMLPSSLPPGGQSPATGVAHPTAAATRRRPRSLWALLVWTYRGQKAHRYLRTPKDWFLWALADAQLVEDMPRASVHGDAALIHAAVLELGQCTAELIAYFAAEGEQPEPPMAIPRPYPTEVDRSAGQGHGVRWSWARIGGRRVDYLIRWTEQVATSPSSGAAPDPVEFCPLTWEPDPDWVINQLVVYRDWLAAMHRLHADMASVTLREHLLDGIGATEKTSPLSLREMTVARMARHQRARGERTVVLQAERGLVTVPHGDAYLQRWVRVRHPG